LIDASDEPVTATWNRLDIGRFCGRIAESLAQPFYSCIQAVIEVAIGGPRPESILQLFPRYQLSMMGRKYSKDLNCLSREFQAITILAKLFAVERQLVGTETD
jgi:hypothetical protein